MTRDPALTSQLQGYLCCPKYGALLKREHVNDEGPRQDLRYPLPSGSHLTARWCADANAARGQTVYPEVDGIPILIQNIQYGEDAPRSSRDERDPLNPFTVHTETDPDWYDAYAQKTRFKTLFFDSQIERRHQMVVELLSSSSVMLRQLAPKYPDQTFVAVDLDFFALQQTHPKILPVCADATTSIFLPGTIDAFLCNSMHHVPEEASLVYQHAVHSLAPEGKFIGVETYGSLSRLILWAIVILPDWMRPYIVKELYTERFILRKWLSLPLEKRLCRAGIDRRLVTTSHNLTHVKYQICKRPLKARPGAQGSASTR